MAREKKVKKLANPKNTHTKNQRGRTRRGTHENHGAVEL
jgi:hypothetical protein